MANSSSLANLKVVIRHHSTWLLKAFEKDIVRYSNHLWQADIISDGVKDRISSTNADVAQRADDLVNNVSKAFSTAKDFSKQTEYVIKLLKFLESEGERELVESMRNELYGSFNIEIPSFYSNPSSDQGRQYDPQSEPADFKHYADVVYTYSEPVVNLDRDVLEPHKIVSTSVQGRLPANVQRHMVLPDTISDRNEYSEPSYPRVNSSRRVRRITLPRLPLGSRSANTRPSAAKSSPNFPVRDDSFDYGGGQQDRLSESSSHYEEQRHLCNIFLIRKYEEEIRELKKKLEEKEEINTLKEKHQIHTDQLNKQIEQIQCNAQDKEELLQRISDVDLKLSDMSREVKLFQGTMISNWNEVQDSRCRFSLALAVIVAFIAILFVIVLK